MEIPPEANDSWFSIASASINGEATWLPKDAVFSWGAYGARSTDGPARNLHT